MHPGGLVEVLRQSARHLDHQIQRALRDWSEAQIGFLAIVVRLYPGEAVEVTRRR